MTPYQFRFVNGPIPESTILQLLEIAHNSKTGAQSLFIGRIRDDEIEDSITTAIEYSAYEDLAYREAEKIIHDLKEKYELHYLIIYHSLGKVAVNQISVAIITGAVRRKQAISACNEAINMIKQQIPIWGLEITQMGSTQWKTNTP
jgi:molybdopterin synthase catalytic subunit